MITGQRLHRIVNAVRKLCRSVPFDGWLRIRVFHRRNKTPPSFGVAWKEYHRGEIRPDFRCMKLRQVIEDRHAHKAPFRACAALNLPPFRGVPSRCPSFCAKTARVRPP